VPLSHLVDRDGGTTKHDCLAKNEGRCIHGSRHSSIGAKLGELVLDVGALDSATVVGVPVAGGKVDGADVGKHVPAGVRFDSP